MNTELITKIEKSQHRTDLPNFKVGDTIEVDNIIREGNKQRVQKFRGLVIAINGSGTRKMFTIRKISYGIGVEKIFPLYSPNISGITVIRHGSSRRSKLYYLRDRIGKLALKVKPGQPAPVIEHADEAMPEDVEPVAAEDTEAPVEEAAVAEETAEVSTEETTEESSDDTAEENAPEASEEEQK